MVFLNSITSYFHVNHFSVINKLKLLVFPYNQKVYSLRIIVLGILFFPSLFYGVKLFWIIYNPGFLHLPLWHQKWSRESAQFNGMSQSEPTSDINAPDLYIPTMSFFTWVLLCALFNSLYRPPYHLFCFCCWSAAQRQMPGMKLIVVQWFHPVVSISSWWFPPFNIFSWPTLLILFFSFIY